MELLDLILDWPALVQRGDDSVAYLVMASALISAGFGASEQI